MADLVNFRGVTALALFLSACDLVGDDDSASLSDWAAAESPTAEVATDAGAEFEFEFEPDVDMLELVGVDGFAVEVVDVFDFLAGLAGGSLATFLLGRPTPRLTGDVCVGLGDITESALESLSELLSDEAEDADDADEAAELAADLSEPLGAFLEFVAADLLDTFFIEANLEGAGV